MKQTNVFYKHRLEKRLRESDEIKEIQSIHHISEPYLVQITRFYGLSEILEWEWRLIDWLRVFVPKEIWSEMPEWLPTRLYLTYKKII